MADFTALKTTIQTYIKQNGNEEITGNILQEVLLAMVQTMGDGAINDLVTDLSDEVTARKNADTTLGNSLQAIRNAIDNGYVYAGIATPTGTPVSGKVFYFAVTAGTYTNFGGLEVTQGINILKYNGSAWSVEQVVGIDDVPTAGSNNLVKSGGVAEEINKIVGTDTKQIDLSPYIAQKHLGIIFGGIWTNSIPGYSHIVVPVTPSQKYKLEATVNSGYGLRYALLKSYSGYGVGPDYCSGWSDIETEAKGVPVSVTIPSDCNYMYLQYENNGNVAVLSVILEAVEGIIDSLEISDATSQSEIATKKRISLTVDNGGQKELSNLIIDSASSTSAGLMSAEDKDNINNTIGGEINLAPYISNKTLGIIFGGIWTNSIPGYSHIIVPVGSGKNYRIKANLDSGFSLRYALLKSYSGYGVGPDFCDGWTNIEAEAKGTEVNLTMPSDCNYLYLQYENNGSVASLSVVIIGTITDIEEKIDFLESHLKGKKIAWYGTSIPAGSGSYTLPITGYAINAYLAYYGEMRKYGKGQQLPAEYPIIAGSLLGADTVYNHSQGSSRLQRNLTGGNLRYRCLSLMNTAMNNIESIFGAYNIDVTNKTFSRNLDNTVGITTWYDAEYEENWTNFARHTIANISQSYEIRLIAQHLVGENNDSYIHSILGAYYNDIATMLSDINKTMQDFAGYLGDVDLVVLEHSVNDSVSTSVPVDTDNIDSFAGAYSQMINVIRFYKPSMRIAIAANYINFGAASNVEVNDYLGEIAKYHCTPFIDMSDYSQVSWAKQLTCGYWDANKIWHDSGFEWVEDVPNDSYTTNATFPSDIRSTSLAQMKEYINPHQVGGVWCWESASLYQWCADGIHPFSDHTGRLTILIGKVLAKWLNTIEII